MATKCINHGVPDSANLVKCCVTPSGSSVTCTLNVVRGMTYNYPWDMYLQKEENGRWVTIDSRSGYVSNTSPSSRTFTGVNTSRPLRVLIYYSYKDGSYWKLISKYSQIFIM